jgi:Sec-independent protein translocase protein TatA
MGDLGKGLRAFRDELKGEKGGAKDSKHKKKNK